MRREIRDGVGSRWGGGGDRKSARHDVKVKKEKQKRRWLIWNFAGVAEGLAVVLVRRGGSVSGVRRSSGQDARIATEVRFRPTGVGRKQR